MPGLPGIQGVQGVQGVPGLSGFQIISDSVEIPGLGGSGSVAAVCPAGKKALSATADYAGPLSLDNLVSELARTNDTAFSASGLNLLSNPRTLNLDVVCAAIPS